MKRTVTYIVLALAVGTLAVLGGCNEQPMVEDTTTVPEMDTAYEGEDEGPDIREVEEGKPAPDFTAPLADGGQVSLSDYEGKVLVLDFWATWCAACVEELPEYQELYEGWDKEKVGYIAMSADGDLSTVQAFLEGHPEWTMPFAVPSDEVLEAYLPTRTLPSSRVIDQDGIVRYEFKGPAAEKVEEAVNRLLEEGPEAEGTSEE
jgi:peroxiredoxin